MILIKRCSLTRVKLTALYKHLMITRTLTYISNKRNLFLIFNFSIFFKTVSTPCFVFLVAPLHTQTHDRVRTRCENAVPSTINISSLVILRLYPRRTANNFLLLLLSFFLFLLLQLLSLFTLFPFFFPF